MISRFLIFAGLVGAACIAAPVWASSRQVQDAAGQTVILAKKPERIVTLSEIDLDSALALGVKPVGAINGRGQTSLPHYLTELTETSQFTQIQIVGDLGRPKVESIVRLKPDLILTSPQRPEVLTLLRKFAPTFVSYQDGDHWKDVFARVAAALGREAEAQRFMADYNQKVKAAQALIAPFKDRTASIVRWNPNGPAFMYQDSFASLVLRELGLQRPAAQQVPGQHHSMPLSLESLEKIDAHWLFIGTLDPKEDAAKAMDHVRRDPAFLRLASVKGGRDFVVDGSKWTSIGGPLAALSIVQETSVMIRNAQKASN